MIPILNSERHQQTGFNSELAVIQGCIDSLKQGEAFLASLTSEQYLASAEPYVTSSIGEHFRHILDVYRGVYLGVYSKEVGACLSTHQARVIDYNQRRRGHRVETCRLQALAEIEELLAWLECLTLDDVKAPVQVISEVSVSQTQSAQMCSTLERELTFIALHANHHFAMTKVTMTLLGRHVAADFGFAPATLTYMGRS
ncbi:DinB family protein [Marinomonas posidonica]|uniref:DinB family protein n=1 Tax=Marinomonas posidonica TaxID=936476 RepID=UPI003736CCFB